MIDRRRLLRLFATLSLTPSLGLAAAHADDRHPADGAFTIWMPSNWIVTQPEGRLAAHAPDEGLYLSAEQRALPAEGLKTVDADAILDRELDDFDITLDELRSRDKVIYRRVEGTGKDEEDNVRFRMRMIGHPAKPLALVALVWGEDEDMNDPASSGIADQILASLKGV